MPSSTLLLIAALYNAALLQASSAVPPIGLSTGSSLVLTTGTLASASSGLPGGNSSSTYNPSIQSSMTLPSQSQSGSSTQVNTSPSPTAPSSIGSAPAPWNSHSSSSADSASSTGSSSSAGPSSSAGSSSLAGSSSSVGPSSPSGSSSSQAPSSISGETDVVATVSGTAVTETFIPTIYPEYSSLTAPLSTFTIDAQSSTMPLIIGSGGVGWQIPSQPPSASEIPPPTVLPTPPTAPSATPSNSITSAPSSTHTLSGTELTSTSIEGVTKNTVTTTSEDGHQTVLPIVFCPGCGGGGGGGHGLSWIIHPPSINPPGGIEFNIPGVNWLFTVDPSGNPEPVDPSKPEPEHDNNSSQSKESNSQSSTSQATSSGSSSASSSGSSSASSSGSSSSSATRTGSATIATDADVDPYLTDPPQNTIADVQAYLSSMFATEFEQVGTTLESMTSSPTGSSSPPSSTPPSSITNPPSSTASTSASPVTCLNNPVDENPPGCIQPSSSSAPFSCSAGSNLGVATYDPATWCGCNSGTNIYPTMTTGTGNAACAYTTPPGTTVKPTQVTPTTTPPPSSTAAARPPGQTISESDGTVCFLPDGSTDPDCNDPPPSTTPPPATSSTSPPPSSGTCNCNEDGCTSDSPACCADGSCPASVAAVPRFKFRRQ